MNTYVLLPSDEPPGYRVERVSSDQDAVRASSSQPFSFKDEPAFCEMAPIVTIDVVRYGRVEHLTRRERRQRARAKGRRRAVSVPVETQWETRIAAHPAVRASVVRAFVDETAEVVRMVWNRRATRTGR